MGPNDAPKTPREIAPYFREFRQCFGARSSAAEHSFCTRIVPERQPFSTPKATNNTTMGAGGSIPATAEEAKAAGKFDEEIALYQFCTGIVDGSSKDQAAEGCEFDGRCVGHWVGEN